MIKLIAIGKNKDKALQSLEKEYMKRLSAFCKFSEIEVKDEANEHVSREAEVLLVKEKGKSCSRKIIRSRFCGIA
ncbi:MAG: 23S rRNA (pseudouridine(1915)-N(3))-methyltransferase RlmH [Holdemanella porci]